MKIHLKMKRTLNLSLAGVLACSVVAVSAPVWAQGSESKDSPSKTEVVPASTETLRERMSSAYSKINTYKADIDIEIKPLDQPDAKAQHYSYTMAYDRAASALLLERPELSLVVNKDKLQLQASDISERHLAIAAPTPLTLPGLFEKVPYIQQPMPYDLTLLLGDSEIPADAKELAADETGRVGLGYSSGPAQFVVRVDPKTHLISQIQQTVTHERNGQKMSLMFTYNYKVNVLDKPLDDKTFQLKLGDSKPVDNFKDLVGNSQASSGESPLQGKVAPDFTLKDNQGNDVALADLQKKYKVVVFDFWATWCGPCRMTLPQLQKVHDWVASEKLPVAIYTVNQGETVDKAMDMWKSMKLTMPILMDSNSKVSSAYGIRAIPQLLVIKDGKVHSIHLGASPTTGADLKAELQALLK